MGKKGIGVGILVGAVAISGALLLAWKLEHPPAPLQGIAGRGEGRIVAEGRLVTCPDAEVFLKSELSGVIESYTVHEDDYVKKGDLLVSLGAKDVSARLDMAQASLNRARYRLGFTEKQFHRAERLREAHAYSRESLDLARQNFDMAKSGKEHAESLVRLYQFTLLKSRIIAPIDGFIVARHHSIGEYVQAGSRIVTIADLERTWIEAEVDEFDADRVRVLQPVRIRAEGNTMEWDGIVSSISERVTRKHLVPDDPSRPTDTGIIIVKIAPLVHLPLKLGEKVTVKIGMAGGKNTESPFPTPRKNPGCGAKGEAGRL